MHLLRAAFVVVMFLLLASPSRAQDSRDAELRKKVSAYLQATVPINVDPNRDEKLVSPVDRMLAKGELVHILVGEKNTANRKAIYVLTYGGEIQTFELSPAQSRGLGLRPAGVVMTSFTPMDPNTRVDKPVVKLSQLKINNADAAPGDKEITGSFLCKPTGVPITGALSLAITVKRPRNMSRNYTQLKAIPADGIIAISIEALNRGKEELEFGPTPVFVDILVSGPDGRSLFAGNTLSTMVEVLPDIESFAKMGLQSMQRFVDVLASAKDRDSAARAKEQYIQVALQMKELVDAMERLPEQTKQQNAEFDKRHAGELEAMAKRLEAELTRLEQADYAGAAFFTDIQRALQEGGK